jgi:hypothetical protein
VKIRLSSGSLDSTSAAVDAPSVTPSAGAFNVIIKEGFDGAEATLETAMLLEMLWTCLAPSDDLAFTVTLYDPSGTLEESHDADQVPRLAVPGTPGTVAEVVPPMKNSTEPTGPVVVARRRDVPLITVSAAPGASIEMEIGSVMTEDVVSLSPDEPLLFPDEEDPPLFASVVPVRRENVTDIDEISDPVDVFPLACTTYGPSIAAVGSHRYSNRPLPLSRATNSTGSPSGSVRTKRMSERGPTAEALKSTAPEYMSPVCGDTMVIAAVVVVESPFTTCAADGKISTKKPTATPIAAMGPRALMIMPVMPFCSVTRITF